MLATESTAQVSINNTINAYESQIDQEYQTYWQFRNEQPDPSVFDPNFQVTLLARTSGRVDCVLRSRRGLRPIRRLPPS